MISYADVERTYRLERSSPVLQKIPADFYEDVKMLAANPEVGEHSGSILEYLEKIYYQRSNKIIHYAGRATPETKLPDNILPSEIHLYNRILEAVSQTKATVLDSPLPAPEPPQTAEPVVKVRIKQALAAIVGTDSKEYGPFRVDDVVELPEETASILLKRQAAEKM